MATDWAGYREIVGEAFLHTGVTILLLGLFSVVGIVVGYLPFPTWVGVWVEEIEGVVIVVAVLLLGLKFLKLLIGKVFDGKWASNLLAVA